MHIDFNSASWKQIEAWAQAQLVTARNQIEGDLDPNKTTRLRGEIQVLKRILGLPEAAARDNGAEPAL